MAMPSSGRDRWISTPTCTESGSELMMIPKVRDHFAGAAFFIRIFI
jgi:hypothetical protein